MTSDILGKASSSMADVKCPVFYERGCQEKHSDAEQAPRRKSHRGSQPTFPSRRNVCPASVAFRVSSQRGLSQKLKSTKAVCADHSSIRASRAIAFPGRARGDRVHIRVFDRSRGPTRDMILTLDLEPFQTFRRRIVDRAPLPAERPIRLCGQIQFLWIKLLSCLPNDECSCGNLARQSQLRHFGSHPGVF